MVLRICDTFCSVYFSSPTYCGKEIVLVSVAGAELASAAFGAAEGTKLSTSFFTTRPPSAEPFTSFKLIPFSFAILRANGEAFTLESSFELLEAAGAALSALASALGASALSALVDDFGFWFNKGVTSVPAGPTIAIMSFTFAAWPASTPTYNNVPSA